MGGGVNDVFVQVVLSSFNLARVIKDKVIGFHRERAFPNRVNY